MTDDKRIKLGVDNSQALSDIELFNRRAKEMVSELIGESKEQLSLSEDILESVREQIRLLERRNNLRKEERLIELSSKEVEGRISSKDAGVERGDIATEFKEERLTIQYAKDIVDAIERAARAQIESGEDNINKLISEPGFGESDVDKSEIDFLRELIVRDKQTTSESKQEPVSGGGIVGTFSQASTGVIGSQSSIDAALRMGQMGTGQMMQTGMGMGGVAGTALTGTAAVLAAGLFAAAKGVSIAGQAEPHFMRMAGIGGGSYANYREFGDSATEYGYTRDVVAQRRADISLAGLTSRGSGQAALESLQMERGLGISSGVIQQLERFQRPGMSNLSSMESTQQMISYLRATGVITGKDMSALPEYLQSLVSISQQQLQTLGSVDVGINTKMIAGISNLDESFKNPDILSRVVSSLTQGLATSPNSQIEALQYSILNQISPNKDIFELRKMREDPFGTSLSGDIEEARKRGDSERAERLEKERTERQEYLPAFLQALKDISPTRGIFEANILEAFPQLQTLSMAGRVARGFDEGNLNEVLDRDISNVPSENIQSRAIEATGIYTREVAKFTNRFMTVGDNVIAALNSLQMGIVSLAEKTGDLIEATQENTKATNEFWDNQKSVYLRSAKGWRFD